MQEDKSQTAAADASGANRRGRLILPAWRWAFPSAAAFSAQRIRRCRFNLRRSDWFLRMARLLAVMPTVVNIYLFGQLLAALLLSYGY